MYLYLDIETIPTQDDAVRERIAAGVKPPGNISKAETIAKWEAESRTAAVKEAVGKTAIDGGFGHVACIGWAIDGSAVDAMVAQKVADEADVIRGFFADVNRNRGGEWPAIVGHNIVSFDIRFLWQRCMVLGIEVPTWLPHAPKPWSDEVHDTMAMWAGPREMIGLSKLCEIFGIENADPSTGADVADFWARGRVDLIAEHCVADVAKVRTIHRRMMLARGVDLNADIEGRAA